jgi:hypothetical protein
MVTKEEKGRSTADSAKLYVGEERKIVKKRKMLQKVIEGSNIDSNERN